MERTFTLNDLQHYFQEIRQVEYRTLENKLVKQEPGKMAIRNILRYSSALNVLKTKKAGTIYQLVN